MSKKAEIAANCFNDGFNCCQAVLSTFSQEYGLDKNKALQLATGFGGGMGGKMGNTCGAVTGAFMVIGLKHGKKQATDNESKQKTYNLVHEFTKKFTQKNGSIMCKELLGYDISTEDGYNKIYEKDLFCTLCPNLVKSAVSILDELI